MVGLLRSCAAGWGAVEECRVFWGSGLQYSGSLRPRVLNGAQDPRLCTKPLSFLGEPV